MHRQSVLCMLDRRGHSGRSARKFRRGGYCRPGSVRARLCGQIARASESQGPYKRQRKAGASCSNESVRRRISLRASAGHAQRQMNPREGQLMPCHAFLSVRAARWHPTGLPEINSSQTGAVVASVSTSRRASPMTVEWPRREYHWRRSRISTWSLRSGKRAVSR